MAKAKKRVATRKKSSKRGKASAKPGAQEGGKARDAEKSKVQGPARGQWCSETRGQEKAATEDRGKKGTKKNAKTSGCAGRRHDHRRDRGADPRRGCRYGVRIDSDGYAHFVRP
jgi:hypothetical protein